MTKKKILLTLRIGGENGGPYISHSRIMQSALKDKYDMKPLMVPRSRVLLDPCGMKSFVNTIKSENPDLVVVTGLQIEGFLTMIACKKAGVKTLLAVHGSSREALDIGAVSKAAIKLLEHHSIRTADAVFGVSDYVSGWDCLKHAKKHCGTVYNIPSLSGDREPDLRQEFGFDKNDVVIVSTGRITREKGYDLLWQAIQKLGCRDNVKFLIAGDGDYRNEWQSEIEKNGYADRVVLAGYRSDIDAVLNTADIFIICTKHETLCNSILEAYMHALPVIATNVGGIPEIVEHNQSGFLVKNGDVDGFASAIDKLISDTGLRKQYGTSGREIVLEKFDENKIINKLDEIFTKLIN